MAKLGRRVTSPESRLLIERLLGLPWREQWDVYCALGASLPLSRVEPEEELSKRQMELFRRAEALEAMRAAVEHLGLLGGRRIGTREYELARRELGLSISSASIIRRWGAWREAVDVLQGARARTTPRQRAHWLLVNNSERSPEQHLAGVRAWLESEPAVATKHAYDDWALGREGEGQEGERSVITMAPLVTADAVTNALALPWKAVLQVARGQVSLAKAQKERRQALGLEGGSLGLVGVTYVALLHRQSEKAAWKLVRAEGFPVPVAYTTMNRRRVWYRRDVEAHRAGREVPKRRLFEAQESIVLSKEVRELLGQSERDFRRTVARSQKADREGLSREEALDAGLFPKPDGRVNHALYWLREDINAWVKRR